MATSQDNPFRVRSGKAARREMFGRVGLAISTYSIIACALLIFGIIVKNGAPVVFEGGFNTGFFTDNPETLVVVTDAEGTDHRVNYSDFEEWKETHPNIEIKKEETFSFSGGGIAGPLVGTALLVIICMVVTLFIGISAAIFLSEYAKPGNFLNTIRLAIMNLAGVPSIVFGLFGYGFFCLSPWFPVLTMEPLEKSIWAFQVPFTEGFVSFQGFGVSMIAGALTLAIMILPVIITACEESLKAVPKGFREASLALGASKWQSIRTAVLPYAFSGMLTASILGVARVAGETAPIMFTAATAQRNGLPWEDINTSGGFWLSDFLTQSVQAMPYHIYTVAAKIPQTSEHTKPMQHGSIFVFLFLVIGLAAISVFLRNRIRNKIKW